MESKVNEKYKGVLKMLMKKWIPIIFSESRGFLIVKVYWDCIGRGLNNVIFRGIFQYVVKLRILFNMPLDKLEVH